MLCPIKTIKNNNANGGFAVSAVMCVLALVMTVSVLVVSMTAVRTEYAVSEVNRDICGVAVSSAADMICDSLINTGGYPDDGIAAYLKNEIGNGAVIDGGGNWKRYEVSDEGLDESVRTFSFDLPDASVEVFFDMYWECPNFGEDEIPGVILTVSVYAFSGKEKCMKELRFVRMTDGIYTDDYRDSDSEWRWSLYE